MSKEDFISMEFSESLKKSIFFKMFYNGRKSRADRYLVVYVLENGTDRNRLGISVSKKVGNSVVRHHLTRLVREAYRLEEKSFRRGYDIVVVLRVRAADADYHTIRASLLKLSDAHGIRYLKD